jgi:membrane protease subunit HflK
VALLSRTGRYAARLEPGLHLLWPAPFSSVRRIDPNRVTSVEVGMRSGRSVNAVAEDEALVGTGDGRLVEISAVVQVRPAKGEAAERSLAFGQVDPVGSVRPLFESALRSVVGRRSLDALLAGDRRGAEAAIRDELQQRMDTCSLGLQALGVSLQEVQPPRPVLDAYRDVTRAESEKKRRTVDAEAYQTAKIKLAEAQAAAVTTKAAGLREAARTRAEAEAEAFAARIDARAYAPTITDHRLYWDGVAEALGKRSKVILDPAHAGRRHLILPGGKLGAALGSLDATRPPPVATETRN